MRNLAALVDLGQNSYLVGIDTFEERLARNSTADVKTHGDIERHDFGERRFDLILCWNVLEHLPMRSSHSTTSSA